MKAGKTEISAGGVLLLAALYFFMDIRGLAALALAVSAHELGHVAALRLCGSSIRGFRADLGGLLIIPDSGLSPGSELFCLAAGPFSGLLYAFFASCSSSGLLLCSSGMSLALSLFNLLPCPPLDGGGITTAIFGPGVARCCGLLTALLLFISGFALCVGGQGAALFLAGAILLVKNV